MELSTLDRKKAPAFQPLQIPTLPRPSTEILSNGIEISCFPDNNQHLVQVDLIFPAENLLSENRQKDAYSLKMLAEGTRQRDAKKIADDISFLGASLDISHSPETSTISIACLSRFLPKMMEIFQSLWTDATFPEREWKIMVETALQQNGLNMGKTSYLAGRLFRSKLFGNTYDYGYSFDKDLVTSIQSEDLRQHFAARQSKGPGLVVVSGKIEPNAYQQLNDWLSGFHGPSTFATKAEFPSVVPGQFWDNKSDAQQTSLRMGNFSIGSQHPDLPYFGLMFEIFGGYFGSRLMSNIREDKGWTYGIFAQRVGHRLAPIWLIGSDLNGENALAALEEIHKEAEILKTETVSEEELEKVKNYMVGQFLTTVTHCYGLADRFKSLWINGNSFETLEKNLNKMQQTEANQIREMARKYLNLDQAIIVFSGNKPSIS